MTKIRSVAFSSMAFALAVAGCAAPQNQNPSASPTGTPTASPSGTNSPAFCTATGGSIGGSGGTVDCLTFGVVGDTRPATIDDTAAYPTAIITKIYQDLEAEAPKPKFAVSTGDYVYAAKNGAEGPKQLDLYLAAQAGYSGTVFHAMGNHECTGFTASNCGTGNTDGITANYTSFMSKMVTPGGQTKPYYSFRVDATDGSWTSKFVVVAANAWNSAQASWLATAMADTTTYTFVVRHEGIYANTAPGVTPSQNIIASYPYTLLIEGHTHDLKSYPADRELIDGIGGAPLTGSTNYGYVVVHQRSDMALEFTGYDYQTHAVLRRFVVTPSGTPTN